MNKQNEITGVETVTKEFVTIGDASEILGVSIDTIRRWEKAGRLHSRRLDGKNRYFDVDELESYRASQPLSTTEVAVLLSVSPSTVRRLEEQGSILSQRDKNGRRQYERSAIDRYINAQKQADITDNDFYQPETTQPVQQVEVTYAQVEPTPSITSKSPRLGKHPRPDILKKVTNFVNARPQSLRETLNFGFMQRAVVYGIAGSLFLIIVILIAMLSFPTATGDIFWGTPAQDRNLVVRLFKPFAERSLNLV